MKRDFDMVLLLFEVFGGLCGGSVDHRSRHAAKDALDGANAKSHEYGVRRFDRHCEPTGRAYARPMTGSAKQSIPEFAAIWIASSLALLAMTTWSCVPKRRTQWLISPPRSGWIGVVVLRLSATR